MNEVNLEISEKEFAEKVRKIIAEQLKKPLEEIQLESSFKDDLGTDSLDLVELTMALEEELGCSIPDALIDKIKTVDEAIKNIYKIYIESEITSKQ